MAHLKTLILVDDDEIIVYLTKRIITETNLVGLNNIFRNGKDAIDYLRENADNIDLIPDIILLDLSMPVMDGWKFLDEFVKLEPEIDKPITIYIITSSISAEDINRAKKISVVSDYLIKPITRENFIEIITKVTKD
jgi:CheY-like chemotaxis protein